MFCTYVSGDRSFSSVLTGVGSRIANTAEHLLLKRFPVGRDRSEQRVEVRGSHNGDTAGEAIGRIGHTPERRVAAVGAAVDRDLVALRDAVADRPVDAVDQVVVHLAAPLLVGLVDEVLPETGGAAEVHLQRRVTPVGEPDALGVIPDSYRDTTGRRARSVPSEAACRACSRRPYQSPTGSVR